MDREIGPELNRYIHGARRTLEIKISMAKGAAIYLELELEVERRQSRQPQAPHARGGRPIPKLANHAQK